jgi:hypothetical protein
MDNNCGPLEENIVVYREMEVDEGRELTTRDNTGNTASFAYAGSTYISHVRDVF